MKFQNLFRYMSDYKLVCNLTPGHIPRLLGLMANMGVKVRLAVTYPRI